MQSRIRFYLSLLFSVLLLQLLPSTGRATTAIIPGDDHMAIGARAIVQGRIISSEAAYDAGRNMVFTYTTISIEDSIKGPFSAGQEIVVKEMGGIAGNIGTRIYGSPAYQVDEEVLLYLSTWPDGTLRTYEMAFGKFLVSKPNDGKKIVERAPESDEMQIVGGNVGQLSTRLLLKEYKSSLRRTLSEKARQAAEHERRFYTSTPILNRPPEFKAMKHSGDLQPQYTFLANPPIRWFESSVTFSNFSDGMPDGGDDDVRTAMNAWNSVSGIGLNVVFGGEAAGCGTFSGGGNVVTWNNCGGWFAQEGCANILALGGILRFDTSQHQTVKGVVFIRAVQGFFAMNPSAACVMDQHCNVQEIATHELGHALGLGHSQFGDATMAPFAHFDGRCASVKQDDIDGILAIYPEDGGGGDPGQPRITTQSLPGAQIGVQYEATLRAEGGIPPYAWTKVGFLPAGLTINGGGIIRGTPTQVESKTFTVTVSDSRGGHDQKDFTLAVTGSGGGGGGGTLQIATATLPAAQRNVSYSVTLQATGGQTPYAWSLPGNALPAGLSLNTGGVISGTPTIAGSVSFTVRVTDSASATADKRLTLNVTDTGGGGGGGSLRFVTDTLEQGIVDEPYLAQFEAAGGTPPYTYSVFFSTLPPGLSLMPKGVLSGTPSQHGQYQFLIQLADSAGVTTVKSWVLDVIRLQVHIVTTQLLAAQPDVAYSFTMTAAGGHEPYIWSISDGQPPSGISLTSAGRLQGTPSAEGSSTFTIKVTDAKGTSDARPFTLVVGPGSGGGGGQLRITTTALPQGQAGAPYSAQLNASGGTLPYKWAIVLAKGAASGILISSSGELMWTPDTPGDFAITVQVTDGAGASARKDLMLFVAAPRGLRIVTTSPLNRARMNADYNMRFVAEGGSAPYDWIISDGFLPAGLDLDRATGEITGAPGEMGTFEFTISAFDTEFERYDKIFSLTVRDANSSDLELLNNVLPAGSRGTAYSVALQASGGKKPYQFLIVDGALPEGLELDRTTGVIAGKPRAAGNYAFTAAVVDKSGARASKTFTVEILAQARNNSPGVDKVKVKLQGAGLKVQIVGDNMPNNPLVIIDEKRVPKVSSASDSKVVIKKLKLAPGIHTMVVETAKGLRSSPITFVVK